MSILSILALSLFLGLIVGAGVDKSHILPVALIAAIVLYVNRDKIAAGDATTQSNDDSQKNTRPTEDCYAWPEPGQFAFQITGESYQDAIKQLAQETAINADEDSDPKVHILKAHLIPDNDNDTVRVDIDNRTVAHFNREQTRNFLRKLDEKGLSNQITTCGAIITENSEINGKYGVKLDIAPLE